MAYDIWDKEFPKDKLYLSKLASESHVYTEHKVNFRGLKIIILLMWLRKILF